MQPCPSCSRPLSATEQVCPACSTTLTQPGQSPPALASGLVLDGRFEVEKELGRGGYAEVYRGYDRLLGRAVAIKAVRRDQMTGDPARVRERLLQEARLAARLEHPHVVQIYDAGEHEGVPWIAMQLVTGGSLAELVAGAQALDARITLDVMAQVADALDHAHALGIVHRDLKPANVLIADRDRDGRYLVRLGDFGIAQALSEPRDAEDDHVVGTPAYMSPEQIMGETVGLRSDLFSLGSLAYELLTGHRAFSGGGFHDLFFRISQARFEPLRRHRPEFPAEVEDVFRQALAQSPAERFNSGTELVRALRKAFPGLEPEPSDERRIGGFELLDHAGGSLVAKVHKARRMSDGLVVALKIATDVRAREILRQEARVLGELSHPAITPVLDSGETAEATYIAREWVADARRLPEVMALRRLELGEAIEVAAQAADALAHVHERGFLHLDLRPNSLLLRGDGRVFMGGFDRTLARGSRLAGDLQAMGTPAYLSPEQIRQDVLTESSDLYAFGVFLYELVAGRVPFVDPSPYLTAMRHLSEAAPPLLAACPEAPRELCDLVAALLEKDPQLRPRSMAEVRDRLRRIAPSPGEAPEGRREISYLEWKTVAVAYLDVAGFMDLAERSSESRVAFLLDRWSELVTRTAEQFGGDVTDWMGDSVLLAVIEEPGEESAAVRVLRLLRALHRHVLDMNRTLDWALEFSGGVHVDRVLVGRVLTRDDGGLTLVGRAPGLADALCARARPGEVLLTPQVQAAASSDFGFEPAGDGVFRLPLD